MLATGVLLLNTVSVALPPADAKVEVIRPGARTALPRCRDTAAWRALAVIRPVIA